MALGILIAVWSVALVLAVLTIAVIIRPLFVILIDICGGRDRAWFWTVYASVLTVTAPLLVVSAPGLLDNVAASADSGAVLQRAVFYSLAGIAAALLIMGRAVWRPIISSLVQPQPNSSPTSRERSSELAPENPE